jgi:hypothetical protein
MNKALQQAAAALGNVVKTPPKPIEEPDVVFMISARLMRAPVVFEFNERWADHSTSRTQPMRSLPKKRLPAPLAQTAHFRKVMTPIILQQKSLYVTLYCGPVLRHPATLV